MGVPNNVPSNGDGTKESKTETKLIEIIKTHDGKLKLKTTMTNDNVEYLLRTFLLQYERTNITKAVVDEVRKKKIITL